MINKGHNDIYNYEEALVLMSGGQDSTTSLFWALEKFKKVHAISFDYDQKHKNEINIAAKICNDFNITHKIVDISFMKDLVISNLFSGSGDISQKHQLNNNVPSSFVPYRNMLFLNLAAAWASTLGLRNLVIGVCETDSSGYADCRDDFIKSMQVSLNLATDFDKKIIIHTPLMWLTKSKEFKLADDLGKLDYIIQNTLTCYYGDETMNDFGKGCGECPACKLRKKGYNEFIIKYR